MTLLLECVDKFMQPGQTEAAGDSDFQLRGGDRTSLVLGLSSRPLNLALGQSELEFGILILSVLKVLSDSHGFLN